MKTTVTLILAAGLFAAMATAQPRYTVLDLGAVGPAPGQPFFVTGNGLVSGAAVTPSGALHAVLWYSRNKLDLGAPGLGGSNSVAFGNNDRGQVVGEAQTAAANGEDFCGFSASGFPGSPSACVPFVWQNGIMKALPTLGGANGLANMINNQGLAVGLAETASSIAGCPVQQFAPVVWGADGVHQLPVYPGDSAGVAVSINAGGDIVGASGSCAPFNFNSGLYLTETHALLWHNGAATDLGNLGGTGSFAGIHACSINSRSQVVGHSDVANDATFHGFFWTKDTGMSDLGTLPGDFASLANGINDAGQVVGASLDPNFSPRAFLWSNGVMTDLNTLVGANPAGLYLLLAQSINAGGEITGLAVTGSGEAHGFLATPANVAAAGGVAVAPSAIWPLRLPGSSRPARQEAALKQ